MLLFFLLLCELSIKARPLVVDVLDLANKSKLVYFHLGSNAEVQKGRRAKTQFSLGHQVTLPYKRTSEDFILNVIHSSKTRDVFIVTKSRTCNTEGKLETHLTIVRK